MCVLSSHLFWTSGLWTHQPGSHGRKVAQDSLGIIFCFCEEKIQFDTRWQNHNIVCLELENSVADGRFPSRHFHGKVHENRLHSVQKLQRTSSAYSSPKTLHATPPKYCRTPGVCVRGFSGVDSHQVHALRNFLISTEFPFQWKNSAEIGVEEGFPSGSLRPRNSLFANTIISQ